MKGNAAPKDCQHTLGYTYMFQNGICQTGTNFFSKMLKFSDINYQVAERNEQISIFSQYCELLNYFDSNISVQITVHNRRIDKDEFQAQMLLPMKDDELDYLRVEYNDMLLNKAVQGQNSIVKEKYITFGIEADNYDAAVPALARIETDISAKFKGLGCDIKTVSGAERLEYMNSILNPAEPLKFDYTELIGTGLSTKDFITPYCFDFKPDNKQIHFEMGDFYAQVLMIKKLPSDMSDKLLNALSEIPCNTTINIHTNSMDNSEAVNMVNTKIAFMEQDKANRQSKLLQQGNDPDLIPHHLKRSLSEANLLIDDIQNKNQRLFKGSFLVFTSAKSREELRENVEKLKGVARSYGCALMPLAYEQEAGLNATLPFAKNDIKIRRTLTTAAQAIFVPFTSQELFQSSGMYYGLNALSRNLIFLNRLLLKNPAGFILGTPGAGKSFSVKREILNRILSSENDEILCIDPESEYGLLCKNLGGEVIKISADTDTYFNPLDINEGYVDIPENGESGENPLAVKTEFMFSFLDVVMTGESGNGLTGAERTLVDRVLTILYRDYFKKKNSPMPTLVDFCKALENISDENLQKEKNNLIKILGLYTTGSFNLFAHHTNVDVNNRFVVYDIKDLGEQLKQLGMLVILDQVWNRVCANRELGKRTWIVIDESHLLFANKFSAQFLSSLWKRARKYGGVCTAITQNVEDLLESDYARKMLSNSEFIMMLNQATADRVKLGEILNISPTQLGYVTNASAGQGLLFAGNSIVPFVDKFPEDTKMFKMMTTKFSDISGEENE